MTPVTKCPECLVEDVPVEVVEVTDTGVDTSEGVVTVAIRVDLEARCDICGTTAREYRAAGSIELTIQDSPFAEVPS